MNIGIGIDTGGTYTDGVIFDYDNKRILSEAKSLTTKEDLSLGIGRVLDLLDQSALRQAKVAALSTTLATNACVENKGGRARLLLMGFDPFTLRQAGQGYGLPAPADILFVPYGEEEELRGFYAANAAWFAGAEALALVEMNAMHNGGKFEERMERALAGFCDLPVIRGAQLFNELNSLQRAASALLNARLLPIIDQFIQAAKQALTRRGVTAPLVIVRSDGSVMSEGFTKVRPVETLLCGPAASVLGGAYLTGRADCLIVDMGGTTTDIAIVKDHVPVKARDGVRIGPWRTFVKGVQISTFGLGGDSAVRYDRDGRLLLSAQRVLPMCMAAQQYPEMADKLERLNASIASHTRLLHEFFCLSRPLREADKERYTQEERKLCRRLAAGPLTLAETAELLGTDIYNVQADRLEREGVVLRAGLTPTDIMHLTGDFTAYDSRAAKEAAVFVAGCVGLTLDKLCERVYHLVEKKLYTEIVQLLLRDQNTAYRKNDLPEDVRQLIGASYDGYKADAHGGDGLSKCSSKKGFLSLRFETPAALVGVGAPIHVFLPRVAAALSADCVIPEHARVANAVGAATGQVSATVEIEVQPDFTPSGVAGYTIYGRKENAYSEKLEEAKRVAMVMAEEAARREIVLHGAVGEVTLTAWFDDNTAETRQQGGMFLGTKAVVRAVSGMGL